MTAVDFVLGAAALLLLVAPGWIAARIARLDQPLLAGLIGGVTGMAGLLVLLDALGLSLTLATVGGCWIVVTSFLAWRKRSHAASSVSTATTAIPAPGRRAPETWPLLLPLLPAGAVVLYRAIAQPLFGIDTVFRWHHLAERMWTLRTLAFYPPVTPADFSNYGWPDGIGPAVSGAYFWVYLLGGGPRPALTAPLVVLQYALLLLTAGALARRWFSDRSGPFAIALLACSPLVAWATAMGQETGFTALALGGLLLYLPRARNEEATGALLFAGLAAGLGALAREYGLVLIIFGAGLGVARRLTGRGLLTFAGAAALAALPWYARNAFRTGNPLFNLDVAGLFPVNTVHAWLMQSYHLEFGWAHLPPEAPRQLLVNGAAALLGLAAGGLLFPRRGAALLAAIAVFAACWAASVSYTAAGFTYALRVLNPALLLAAVLGGAALAHWIPGRRNLAAVAFALTLFATDAALRSLTLPANVYRLPPAAWLDVGQAVRDFHARPIYREFVRVAGSERMLVLGPDALLTSLGARTVPPWSPEVAFLFDAPLTPPDAARRLRAAGIGFVLLNKGPANERFLARSAFFRDPAGELIPVWSDPDMILLQVRKGPAI